jgi:hypothetical protein
MMFKLLARTNFANSKFDIFFIPALLLFGVGIMLMKYLSWPPFLFGGKKSFNTSDSLLLLLLTTHGVSHVKIADKTINGIHYTVYEDIKTSKDRLGVETSMQLGYSYIFELSTSINTHFIGLNKSNKILNIDGRIATNKYEVERVILEGNFDQYFTVYCAAGKQVTARYILSPDNMQIFVDYFKSYSWEILGSKLYVVGANLELSTEKGVIKDSIVFIGNMSKYANDSLLH